MTSRRNFMRAFLITLIVSVLCCSAFSQSHPAQFGWKERTTEKFTLSNRAERKFPLQIPAKGRDPMALVEVQLTAKYPVSLSVQNARRTMAGTCRHLEVTQLAATCSFRRDNVPKYIVISDANQAALTEGAKGANAMNRVTLTISDYACVKNCTDSQ